VSALDGRTDRRTGRSTGRRIDRAFDLRPLDPVRSIKLKLGVVVVASLAVGLLVATVSLQLVGTGTWWALAAAMTAALVLTQVLAHGMTSPLRQMTAAATAMAAGRPVPAVATTSRDEVGRLARAFTEMSAQVAAADAQRRALLADVAHELRTPVAALRAELENLVDGVRPADRDALAETLWQAERLGALVEDLLDLARAEGTDGLVDPTAVELGPLADDVARQVARAHGVPPVLVLVAPGLVVWADEARLRQVLTNLLDNAVRHGSRGGRVAVVGQPGHDGGVVVEVQDDGPGIPVQERAAVFERFRTASTVTRGTGGTGLGLAIARWAVQLHGGRIGVVEAGPGCTVRVELPAGPGGAGV